MIYGIQIFSPEFKLQKTSDAPLRLPGVKTGQLIRARILELLPQGSARLMVAGQQVVAKTDLPLTPGTDLLLEVGREKGGLFFKPVSKGSGVQPQSQSLPLSPGSGNPASLAGLLSRINDHLPELGKLKDPSVRGILHTLALKSGTRDNQILPRLLENLGLSLEKKIGTLVSAPEKNTAGPAIALLAKQDLKAAILHLLSTETQEPGAKPLRGISSALESLQQLNTQTGESSRFLLPFPVLAGEFFEFGHLFVNTGEKGTKGKEKENRVIQIAFLMNMTSLGSVRADFSILKKEITGRFLLEDQNICDYIRSLVPELRQRLLSLNYKAGSIECRVGSKRALSPDALVRSMAGPEDSRGLDLVI